MSIKTYNKIYKVKPRYFSAYKGQEAFIITKDKFIYAVTLKHFRRNYKAVTTARQGKAYVIQGRKD